MRDISYIFRTHWLAVPDLLYFLLLFSGWIVLLASTVMIIREIIRKKEKVSFRSWTIAFVISLVMIVLTMTGKIAPYCSFGG